MEGAGGIVGLQVLVGVKIAGEQVDARGWWPWNVVLKAKVMIG